MIPRASIPAPAGWGYPPGYPMGEITEADLPELPLLHLVDAAERNSAITAALKTLPHLRSVRPCHLVRRYALTNSSAVAVIDRARGRYLSPATKKRVTNHEDKAA